jgi:hypothetical protein
MMFWIALIAIPVPDFVAGVMVPVTFLVSAIILCAPVAWFVLLFCLPIGLWGVVSLRRRKSADPERWRAGLRLLLVGVLAWTAWFASQPLMQLRYAAASACAARFEPVIAALRDYRLAEGRYPNSLNELKPRYLKEIPQIRTLAYGGISYYQADSRPGSGGYELVMGMEYGMAFDNFVYWPSERYPSQMSPGGTVPVGKWAYVHD